MPENIESPLNWPQAGLAGVPESDNGLTPGASGSAESANGADDAAGADAAGPSDGNHGESQGAESKAPTAGPAKGNRSDLGEGIATIARSIDEFSKTADALRARAGKGDTEVDARLAETEATLQRLKEAAAGVSEKLEQINGVLDHRLEGLNT
ncbi:MAG TPA: DUF948 domain-containing protein, partial [Acidimicrobiales bacterium]|nr:DUF948 domain-containing protein [Acidimicrobiales bacterium]